MQFIYKIKSINGNNMLRLQHRYNIITGTITRNTLRSSYINVCKEGLKLIKNINRANFGFQAPGSGISMGYYG